MRVEGLAQVGICAQWAWLGDGGYATARQQKENDMRDTGERGREGGREGQTEKEKSERREREGERDKGGGGEGGRKKREREREERERGRERERERHVGGRERGGEGGREGGRERNTPWGVRGS